MAELIMRRARLWSRNCKNVNAAEEDLRRQNENEHFVYVIDAQKSSER